ncbi:MAG: AraC-like DNA-binding protein [Arenicella sp.]|jgi:AraC-like DNA-binding protein
MDSVIFAVRFLALSQVVLLLISLAISKNPPCVRTVGAGLFIGIIGYLLGPIADARSQIELTAFLYTLASLTPMFILLFVWVGFEEKHTFPTWFWGLIVINVLLEIGAHAIYTMNGTMSSYMRVMQLVEISLVILALILLWRGKEEDLVETRAKLRNWSILGIALLTLLILFLHLVTAHLVPDGFELFFMFAVFALTLSINFAMLKVNPSGQITAHGKPKIVESKDPLISNLLDRMQDERLYADHDLRVAKLADMVGLPEHSLRKKINKQLGYRNFNQFVNRYRIEEAGQRLNKEPTIPVLSVALDVGFRSISSFNTAFQSQFGMSPTEYRRQSLA